MWSAAGVFDILIKHEMPYFSLRIKIKLWPPKKVYRNLYTLPYVQLFILSSFLQWLNSSDGLTSIWATCQSLNTLNSDPFSCCWPQWMALPWKWFSLLHSCLSISVTATADRMQSTSKIRGHVSDIVLQRPDALHELHCAAQTSAKFVGVCLKTVIKKGRPVHSHHIFQLPTRDNNFIGAVCCTLPGYLICLPVSVDVFFSISTFYSLSCSISLFCSFLQNQ